LRWVKTATCGPTGATFVASELSGIRTGGTFAPTVAIFGRTGGNYRRPFEGVTTRKPVNFVAICDMTGEMYARTGVTWFMIVVRSGMIEVTFDTTAEGKFSSEPWGRAARTAAGASCRRVS
jgi:hypothetical protein